MEAPVPSSGWERVLHTDVVQDIDLWGEASLPVFPVRLVIVIPLLPQVALSHPPQVVPDSSGTAAPPSVNVSDAKGLVRTRARARG